MNNVHPTPIHFWRAAYLCLLLIAAPKRLQSIEEEDDNARRGLGTAVPRHRAFVVRRAFWMSLALVMAALVVGGSVGRAANWLMGSPTASTIAALQIAGAGILLWATLFVRGWDIQSFDGVTVAERVNQWLFRAFYWIGTATLGASITWPLNG